MMCTWCINGSFKDPIKVLNSVHQIQAMHVSIVSFSNGCLLLHLLRFVIWKKNERKENCNLKQTREPLIVLMVKQWMREAYEIYIDFLNAFFVPHIIRITKYGRVLRSDFNRIKRRKKKNWQITVCHAVNHMKCIQNLCETVQQNNNFFYNVYEECRYFPLPGSFCHLIW